jgi:hypothetical protein
MVVSRTCQDCGDAFVMQTEVANVPKPVLIESLPARVEHGEEGAPLSAAVEQFDPSSGECWTWLYGLIAVPNEVHRPAWVVGQRTTLAELQDHRLHRVHRCPKPSGNPLAELVAA